MFSIYKSNKPQKVRKGSIIILINLKLCVYNRNTTEKKTGERERLMARPPYKAEQRNQIFACFVNAASEIMENEGMAELTLRKVAKRAGYNSATLYNYFKDLDHLVMYASMKYFQEYNQNLTIYIADIKDDYLRFISIWEFFCDSAFRHPHAFYNLFYGKYSGELESIIQEYYQVFPEELGEMDDRVLDMLTTGALPERNMSIMRPLVEQGYMTGEEGPIFNEIILYCFKELLSQKIQLGDELDNHALIERQIRYIQAVLRR